MANYFVTIDQREYQVQITGRRLLLDGKSVNCDLASLNGNGLHQLSRGNQSMEVYLTALRRNTYEVLIGGRRVMARVDTAHRRRRRTDAAPTNAGAVAAPMPGLIVALSVAKGDRVNEGDVIAIEEAMKMQMQLRAPCTGHVAKVAVALGDQVEKDQILVRVVEETANSA